MPRPVVVGLNAVVVAVTDEQPRLLTVAGEPSAGEATDGLPWGLLDPDGHRTLELGLRLRVRELTGLELGYVEQLYTFGDRDRDPGSLDGRRRALSVGYLALVRESQVEAARGARWQPVYDFFPWEDWRAGRPSRIDTTIAPALRPWQRAASSPGERRRRRSRLEIAFGLGGAPWDPYKVVDRYELLYEAELVPEAAWDRARRAGQLPAVASPAVAAGGLGRPLALDHRRIAAAALARLRGKLKYRPVVFELLPPRFTLLGLQRVVEALSGVRLHKQNFRRLIERGGLVEGTGQLDPHTGGRPAERFRFRREVLRERPTPGVGLPGFKG